MGPTGLPRHPFLKNDPSDSTNLIIEFQHRLDVLEWVWRVKPSDVNELEIYELSYKRKPSVVFLSKSSLRRSKTVYLAARAEQAVKVDR